MLEKENPVILAMVIALLTTEEKDFSKDKYVYRNIDYHNDMGSQCHGIYLGQCYWIFLYRERRHVYNSIYNIIRCRMYRTYRGKIDIPNLWTEKNVI